ncbi:MAG: RDD family protein [Jatrophihabitantaceae bacterium]
MTQPGQFDPRYGQGGSSQQPGLPAQSHAAPFMPYGNALPASGYGPQLSFAMPRGAELASVGRRIGGYFMELLLAIVTLGIGYFIWMLVVWGRGQTPGKQVLGMYCYRPSTGSTASWGYMLLRWFGQVLESLIPFGFPITSIMMIASNEHKAIHDHIAGTVVLHRTS